MIVGQVLTTLVTVFLLFDGIGKIVGMEESVKATVELGYSENLISTIGILLLLFTILFAIPRTSIIGAVLLTACLGGALASNFRVENPLFSHTLFPVYIAVIAWAGLSMRNKNIIPFFKNKMK
jgi:hypothetical protein